MHVYGLLRLNFQKSLRLRTHTLLNFLVRTLNYYFFFVIRLGLIFSICYTLGCNCSSTRSLIILDIEESFSAAISSACKLKGKIFKLNLWLIKTTFSIATLLYSMAFLACVFKKSVEVRSQPEVRPKGGPEAGGELRQIF